MAHGVAGYSPTNFKTTLESVTPRVPGLELRVIEAGSRLELENRTGEEALVVGYQDEPYLRVGPEGVFENGRSPATYLNASRQGRGAVPGSADPKAAPEWRKVSSEPVARWHDHRVHWMGGQNPPAVRREPGERHTVIADWVVPIRQGNTTVTASGDLLWIPGPSPWPWLAVATVLFAATLFVNRRLRGSTIALVFGGLLVVDIIHAAGTGFSVADSLGTQLGRVVGSSPLSVIGWVMGAIALWQFGAGRVQALPVAGAAAALVASSGGIADLADLSRSQVPFAWGTGLARLAVATSLGVGLGVTLACLKAAAGTRKQAVASR